MQTAFFEPLSPATFRATEATAGPWTSNSQHGGPPSALAARALEQHESDGSQRLARVAVDILRPVPVGELTVTTRMVRPGKRVALAETVMEANGQEVLHARGWRIARSVLELPEHAQPPRQEPPPIPPGTGTVPYFPGSQGDGYLSAVEWRFLDDGGFDKPSRAATWARPKIPLVEGETTSPASAAMLIADSGNGVSSVLDPTEFWFINVELTVALHRDPVGEWLLLDAETLIGDAGTGVARSTLSDTTSPFGTGIQTLLVAPR